MARAQVLRGDDVNGNGGREGEAASPSNGGGVGGPKAVPRASDAGRPDAALAAKLEMVVLREFFGGESSKALQAELITRYLLHQLYCLQVRPTGGGKGRWWLGPGSCTRSRWTGSDG